MSRRRSGDFGMQEIVVIKISSDVEVIVLGDGVMVDVVVVFELGAVRVLIPVVQAE
jgi:hypothetical protein